MIDRTHGLSLTRQAAVLGISRGAVYYVPRPPSAWDLALMRRIDALHLDFPFAGRGCSGVCSPARASPWAGAASAR